MTFFWTMKNVAFKESSFYKSLILRMQYKKILHTKIYWNPGKCEFRLVILFNNFIFFFLSMMRLDEHGLKHRENSRIYTNPCKCVQKRFFTSASLVDIMPALLMLFWGFALSLIILSIEIVHFRLNKSPMDKKQKFIFRQISTEH